MSVDVNTNRLEESLLVKISDKPFTPKLSTAQRP